MSRSLAGKVAISGPRERDTRRVFSLNSSEPVTHARDPACLHAHASYIEYIRFLRWDPLFRNIARFAVIVNINVIVVIIAISLNHE